jgi:DNA repair exonuclease SbcCD ATPase subunit
MALDGAAGGDSHDPQADGLFERVRVEYEQYFAPKTGKEKKDISEARSQAEQAEHGVIDLKMEIEGLEVDVNRFATLREGIVSLDTRREALRRDAEETRAAFNRIKELGLEVETLRAKRDLAKNEMHEVKAKIDGRDALVQEIEQAKAEMEGLEKNTRKQEEMIEGIVSKKSEAETALRKAEQAESKAERIADIRQKDAEYLHKMHDLATMAERLERVDEVRARALKAERILESAKVDKKALNAIEKADRETREKPVHGEMALVIPNILEVEVRSGTEAVDLEKEMEKKKQALQKKCKNSGVKRLEEAQQAFESRKAAEAVIAELGKIEKVDLRDLSYEKLERKVKGLRKHLPEYPDSRPKKPVMAKDLKTAEQLRDEARREYEDRKKATSATRKGLDAIRNEKDSVDRVSQEAQVDLEALKRGLKGVQGRLASLRKRESDQALTQDMEKEQAAFEKVQEQTMEKEGVLSRENPEQAKKRAETDRASLTRVERELAEFEGELAQTRGKLEAKGEKGLHEDLNEALSAAENLIASGPCCSESHSG